MLIFQIFHIVLILSAVEGQFKKPGTRLGTVQLNRLKSTKKQEPIIEKARAELATAVQKDMSGPPRAVPTILVAFNPTPQDLKKFKPDVQKKLLRRKEELKKLTDKGIVGGHDNWNFDGERVYRIAVMHIMKPEKKFRDKVLEIVNAWTSKLKFFGQTFENGPLEAAWGTASFTRAIQSLRNQNELPKNVEKKWNEVIKKFLLPNLKHHDIKLKDGKDKLVTLQNWSASILDALLSIAIFQNDRNRFDFVKKKTEELFKEYFPTDTGKNAETTRDIVHAQFGLGGLINLCEVFHHQGIDLYSTKNNIIAKSMEYHAGIIMKSKIPDDMKGKPINWNGFVSSSWELGLNHYMNRKKMNMPLSSKLLEKHRPVTYTFHWGLGTLTHFHSDGPRPVVGKGAGKKVEVKKRSLNETEPLDSQSPGGNSTDSANVEDKSTAAKLEDVPFTGEVKANGTVQNIFLGTLQFRNESSPPPPKEVVSVDGGTVNSTATAGVVGFIKLGNGTESPEQLIMAETSGNATSDSAGVLELKLDNESNANVDEQ